MMDFSFTELAVVAIVALLVIGPKELPNALRHLGRITGKARAMTRHVRSGFDEMVRQAEMEEMEKEWRKHNASIMAAAAGTSTVAPHANPFDTRDPAESQPGDIVPDLPAPIDPYTSVGAEPPSPVIPPHAETQEPSPAKSEPTNQTPRAA
jgi:sec-independent protein translocase protein TatB